MNKWRCIRNIESYIRTWVYLPQFSSSPESRQETVELLQTKYVFYHFALLLKTAPKFTFPFATAQLYGAYKNADISDMEGKPLMQFSTDTSLPPEAFLLS